MDRESRLWLGLLSEQSNFCSIRVDHGAERSQGDHFEGHFLSPARPVGGQGPERVLAQMAAAAVRMTSRTLSGWDSMGQWLLSNS
jgi:hypothetical protein